MVAEVIREQVLVETSEEVPYATTVVIEQFEEKPKLTRIAAAIFCERDGQKGILVGKGGQMLKKIGTAARLQIEEMLGQAGISGTLCEGSGQLAGITSICRGTGLAAPVGAFDRKRQAMNAGYFARNAVITVESRSAFRVRAKKAGHDR